MAPGTLAERYMTGRIKRREFLILGGGAAAWPLAARAEVSADRPLIACLSAGSYGRVPLIAGFQEEMRDRGYYGGRNIDIVYRFAENRLERLDGLADELVRLKPAVIMAPAMVDAVAARKATGTIPIVSAALAEPVSLGLVASAARPGGNVTGIMPDVDGLPAKQLDLVREIVSGASSIGVLGDMSDPTAGPQRRELEKAARALGVRIIAPELVTPADLEGAVATLANERVDVVIALQTAMLLNERRQIAALLAAKRLPTVYGDRAHVEAGGLISYGIDLGWCGRRAAIYVQKILTGAAPGDLPVEVSTRIEMVINLTTAKALGLAIPEAVRRRADEMIE
jgi:putative tryptophan/tyrosine transport system substrate-binding protein